MPGDHGHTGHGPILLNFMPIRYRKVGPDEPGNSRSRTRSPVVSGGARHQARPLSRVTRGFPVGR